MHDEDNAIGFNVSNTAGDSWVCYGDKRALDEVDADNLKHCVSAVQASADEIFAAYKTKKVPSPSSYAAWTIVPTLQSARATDQTLATLFSFQAGKRVDIKKRRVWNFTDSWWFLTTAFEIKTSGYWNYPITIDGPGLSSIIPWTAIAVVVLKSSFRVFYQLSSGDISQGRAWEQVVERIRSVRRSCGSSFYSPCLN